MSNQRAGKTYRAAATDTGATERQIRDLMQRCYTVLADVDEDAAFYFEQIVDHINDGNELPTDLELTARMLGV